MKDSRGKFHLERNDRIDFLRGIGLLCIVLAHVRPPEVLFQIRNFDVPLMILVAGSAFAISDQKRPKYGYIKYIRKRFIRLVVPTWIFLVIFFMTTLVLSLLMHKPYPFSSHKIISSFLLWEGIGYLWVIRVFLLVSLITPFIEIYYKHHKNNTLQQASFIMFVVYLIYEISVHCVPESNNIIIKIMLNDIIYMAIPYGLIFFLGTQLHAINGKRLLTISFIIMLMLVVCATIIFKLNGHIVPTQRYKYPPTAYYILYALFASFVLYWFSQTTTYSRVPGKMIISFLGRSSMWIYLWHILFLYLISWSHISMNFVIKYIVVLGATVGVVMAQGAMLEKLLRCINDQKVRKILQAVFSG